MVQKPQIRIIPARCRFCQKPTQEYVTNLAHWAYCHITSEHPEKAAEMIRTKTDWMEGLTRGCNEQTTA